MYFLLKMGDFPMSLADSLKSSFFHQFPRKNERCWGATHVKMEIVEQGVIP